MITPSSLRSRQISTARSNRNQTQPKQQTQSTSVVSSRQRSAKRQKNDDEVSNVKKKESEESVKKLKRKGALKMMLDVLFEIFCRMHPQGLLLLSRTTKTFRDFLTSRSAIRFWKASFQSYADEFPPCFPKMNELEFANLLFSPHCHNFTRPNIQTILWDARARYCSDCKRKITLARNRDWDFPAWYCRICWNERAQPYLSDVHEESPNAWHNDRKFRTDRNEMEGLEYEWEDVDFKDEKARTQAFAERIELVKERKKIAKKCRKWYNEKRSVRSGERDEVREERFTSILSNLRELSYDVKIDEYPELTKSCLSKERMVVNARPLTHSVWKKLKTKAVKIMKEVRKIRLEYEHKEILHERIELLLPKLASLRREHGDINIPAPKDFLNIPLVRNIMDAPVEASLTAEDLMDGILPVLTEIQEQWKSGNDEKLVRLIRKAAKVPKDINPLTLAAGKFIRCKHCHEFRCYPNILAHTCDHYLPLEKTNPKDRYPGVVNIACADGGDEEYYYAFNIDHIESIIGFTEPLLTMLGYDASKVTLEEVDSGNCKLLVCTMCEDQFPGCIPYMEWKTMLEHLTTSGAHPSSTFQELPISLATDAETSLISTMDAQYRAGYYFCPHCDDIFSPFDLEDIRSHLQDEDSADEGPDDPEEAGAIPSFDSTCSIEAISYRHLISNSGSDTLKESSRTLANEVLADNCGIVCDFAQLEIPTRKPFTRFYSVYSRQKDSLPSISGGYY
ncbi:hypothetical protein ABKN59_002398 [Abortiporus biennis]